MAPVKRTKKQKLKLFLTDFDKLYETRRQEIERHGKNLVKQVENFYVQETCKLPKATREMNLDEFLAANGQDMTAKLEQIEEDIKKAFQLRPVAPKPNGTAASVASKPATGRMETPAGLPPPSTIIKQQFKTGTMCRKALPNEMLWSSYGSPVVVDPRAAHGQNKIQATIAVKEGTLALTDSPLLDDTEKCPRLYAKDLEAIKNLQEKLSKMMKINAKRTEKEQHDYESSEPSTSKM